MSLRISIIGSLVGSICYGQFLGPREDNRSKCEQQVTKVGFYGGFIYSTGTSSSTGECALIQSWKVDFPKWFFHSDEAEIKKESSRGEGESLRTMAGVFKCDELQTSNALKMVQLNYSEIFEKDGGHYEAFEKIFKESCPNWSVGLK